MKIKDFASLAYLVIPSKDIHLLLVVFNQFLEKIKTYAYTSLHFYIWIFLTQN